MRSGWEGQQFTEEGGKEEGREAAVNPATSIFSYICSYQKIPISMNILNSLLILKYSNTTLGPSPGKNEHPIAHTEVLVTPSGSHEQIRSIDGHTIMSSCLG